MNLKKNVFCKILFFISIILIIYTFYRSEIIWNGEKRIYYSTYYLVSSVILIFSIILNFLNNKIRYNILVIFFSLIISLYLYEGFLTYKIIKIHKMQMKFEGSIAQKKQIYENTTGKKFDTRSKWQVIEDEKTTGQIVIPVQPYKYLEEIKDIFPLSGISNSKTIQCNQNGYYIFYKSDRYGFHNPDYEWNNPNIEYYLAGDAFPYGVCVKEKFQIASILRDLSKKSVINLSYGGNGPLIEFATLREYMQGNVKKVIWFYNEVNDLEVLIKELEDNILYEYFENQNFSQNLIQRQNEIDEVATKKFKLAKIRANKEKGNFDKSYLFKFSQFIKLYNFRSSLRHHKPLNEFEKILKLTKDMVTKNETKLFFVYLPEYARYANPQYSNDDYLKIKKILNQLDISLIDINDEVFLKEKNPLELFPFKLYGHYTPEAYEKISKIIYLKTKKE